MSKEHVLARWLEGLFPRTATDTHTHEERSLVADWKPGVMQSTWNRQGRAHTKQSRVVCIPCNGGWLRDNQDATKPILVELIRGQSVTVDAESQRNIAFWATRMAMISEHLDPRKPVITQEQRTYFMNRLKPPPGWFVWIGGYGGPRPLRFQEMMAHESGTFAAPPGCTPVGPYHVHSATIGLGRLLIYVAASDIPDQSFEFAEGVMWPIWPDPHETIQWLPPILASDEDVTFMSRNKLRHFPFNLPADWGPPFAWRA